MQLNNTLHSVPHTLEILAQLFSGDRVPDCNQLDL